VEKQQILEHVRQIREEEETAKQAPLPPDGMEIPQIAITSEAPVIVESTLVPNPNEKDTGSVHVPKRRLFLLWPLSLFVTIATLTAGIMLLILPLFSPTATIIIVPRTLSFATLAHIPVQGRMLPAITVSQAQTVSATGKGHENAQQATGVLTFFNGSFASQTIAAGTTFNVSNTITIVTDQPVTIPAGSPPTYGQANVFAHALVVGTEGNIPARTINQACCASSIFVSNLTPFHGGENARDFTFVTKTDIQRAIVAVTAMVTTSEHSALQAQRTASEGLLTLPCTSTVQSDHHTGDEAATVTVIVSNHCTALAYNQEAVQTQAIRFYTAQAATNVGTGYSLVGAMRVSVLHGRLTNGETGTAFLMVRVSGTWMFQIGSKQEQYIKRLIAGKQEKEAKHLILAIHGVQRATISSGSDTTTLPQDPGHIRILIMLD